MQLPARARTHTQQTEEEFEEDLRCSETCLGTSVTEKSENSLRQQHLVRCRGARPVMRVFVASRIDRHSLLFFVSIIMLRCCHDSYAY